MSAVRTYILDTAAVRRNSPLVLAAMLAAGVKRYLTEDISRPDIASCVTSVNMFQENTATIVTGRPIINFELRGYEGGIKQCIIKTLNAQGKKIQPAHFFINYR